MWQCTFIIWLPLIILIVGGLLLSGRLQALSEFCISSCVCAAQYFMCKCSCYCAIVYTFRHVRSNVFHAIFLRISRKSHISNVILMIYIIFGIRFKQIHSLTASGNNLTQFVKCILISESSTVFDVTIIMTIGISSERYCIWLICNDKCWYGIWIPRARCTWIRNINHVPRHVGNESKSTCNISSVLLIIHYLLEI